MVSHSRIKHTSHDNTMSPVARLSAHFEQDMKAVNAKIMDYMQSDVALIPQVASYLISAGGKRIRPLLTLASTALYGGDMERAYGLAATVEFIHTATLLHDDVVDDSKQRRGQDAANLVFGNQASVLVGDFLFSRAFQLMVADGSLTVLKSLSDASAIIAEGEVLQLGAMGNIDTSMDTYIKIVSAKTAALFDSACEVGALIADVGDAHYNAMSAFGLNMGIAFQIADDALDYDAHQKTLGKTVGDDFREGKMTAPVILAHEAGDFKEKEFWTRVISKPDTQTAEDLAIAQSYIAQHDTISKSLDMAQNYGQKAKEALKNAPDHVLKNTLIDLVDYTINRSA